MGAKGCAGRGGETRGIACDEKRGDVMAVGDRSAVLLSQNQKGRCPSIRQHGIVCDDTDRGRVVGNGAARAGIENVRIGRAPFGEAVAIIARRGKGTGGQINNLMCGAGVGQRGFNANLPRASVGIEASGVKIAANFNHIIAQAQAVERAGHGINAIALANGRK